jgi:hypothetical protein
MGAVWAFAGLIAAGLAALILGHGEARVETGLGLFFLTAGAGGTLWLLRSNRGGRGGHRNHR